MANVCPDEASIPKPHFMNIRFILDGGHEDGPMMPRIGIFFSFDVAALAGCLLIAEKAGGGFLLGSLFKVKAVKIQIS